MYTLLIILTPARYQSLQLYSISVLGSQPEHTQYQTILNYLMILTVTQSINAPSHVATPPLLVTMEW